jgi:hypothetical protein
LPRFFKKASEVKGEKPLEYRRFFFASFFLCGYFLQRKKLTAKAVKA